jgi:hypothetical protein
MAFVMVDDVARQFGRGGHGVLVDGRMRTLHVVQLGAVLFDPVLEPDAREHADFIARHPLQLGDVSAEKRAAVRTGTAGLTHSHPLLAG